MKVLVVNGANLDLLGRRDPVQYGDLSLAKIENFLKEQFPEDDFYFFQSNVEGDIVGRLHEALEESFDGLIINPGGYAHTSVVIHDALELLKIPKIEVHLSNLASRESFRQVLITAAACDGYISGLKEKSYIAAAFTLHFLKTRR
ncbi:MAG: 3-dehydroquinate dehydratase [Ignavibacteriales bacterium]|nr:MAG: 3-dehydroquinate dehydratase [Ignavibacteriales bacterium]